MSLELPSDHSRRSVFQTHPLYGCSSMLSHSKIASEPLSQPHLRVQVEDLLILPDIHYLVEIPIVSWSARCSSSLHLLCLHPYVVPTFAPHVRRWENRWADPSSFCVSLRTRSYLSHSRTFAPFAHFFRKSLMMV